MTATLFQIIVSERKDICHARERVIRSKYIGIWESLCNVMGNPEWTQNEKFADSLSCWKNQEEMDRHIEEWTQRYTTPNAPKYFRRQAWQLFPA
jgi:crotonobetainyl-CoA:carnitine CoA-transferase CaiB-like acyl-CoA transferase